MPDRGLVLCTLLLCCCHRVFPFEAVVHDGGDRRENGRSSDAMLADGSARADSIARDGGSDSKPDSANDAFSPGDAAPDFSLDLVSDAPASDLSATGWVQIVKGSFSMGSPATEPCRDTDEDEHLVTLSHDFEMQSTEVTQEQFATLMSYNPSYFGPNGSGTPCGTDCPVESVTWHEAAAYCNALSTRDGKAQCYACSGSGATVTCGEAQAHSGQNIYECPGYRLPTEAEWEYAYRAGTTTAFYSGVKDDRCPSCPLADANAEPIGWYCANSGNTTHPVGKKRANAWGLYDMAGNVWEWCNDWYQSSLGFAAVRDPWGVTAANNRTLRGGSWGGAALEVIERNRPQASPPDPEDHRVDRRASCSPMATWQDCA